MTLRCSPSARNRLKAKSAERLHHPRTFDPSSEAQKVWKLDPTFVKGGSAESKTNGVSSVIKSMRDAWGTERYRVSPQSGRVERARADSLHHTSTNQAAWAQLEPFYIVRLQH